MEHDDARARELTNLKLALATFALQLDAFELRAKAARHAAGKVQNPVPPPGDGGGPRKDNMIGRQ
ncbi:MAG TPA: hypothetical protein VN065_08735 [Bradyrhizobium sp.]|jgi:hypothetical protein|nr:hypothetical protein [Bradyrhizobium sp.]